MRHIVTLQRVLSDPNDYGTPQELWSDVATYRAELISQGDAEAVTGAAGERETETIMFRIRAFGGITLADRLVWRAAPYHIVGIDGGDWNRAEGITLHCVKVT